MTLSVELFASYFSVMTRSTSPIRYPVYGTGKVSPQETDLSVRYHPNGLDLRFSFHLQKKKE
jgi:hypothetical protein